MNVQKKKAIAMSKHPELVTERWTIKHKLETMGPSIEKFILLSRLEEIEKILNF